MNLTTQDFTTKNLTTHILNIDLSNPISDLVEANIRNFIYEKINGVPITKDCSGIKVSIKWILHETFGCYITNSKYSDLITNEHSRSMLNDVLNQFKQTDNFDNSNVKIDYIVLKPISIVKLNKSDIGDVEVLYKKKVKSKK